MKQSQEQKINISVKLEPEKFAESAGIFSMVHTGQLMQIVNRFSNKGQEINQNDILQLLVQRDQGGRTPVDLALFLNFKNIALYLLMKLGTPAEYISQQLNIDESRRTCFHGMAYKGNYESLVTILNFQRASLKKVFFDQLHQEKQKYRFKNLDIKQGHLVSTVFHDNSTIRRHQDFNASATSLFEKYSNMIVEQYRSILMQIDSHGRNPLHYVAMSKYTKCFKTLQALLTIDIDQEPDYQQYLKHYFDMSVLDADDAKTSIDPRKSSLLIKEFTHLLSPVEFNAILKDFKLKVKNLIKQALSVQDNNSHTPLHIASYFGDFKQSRLMFEMGAQSVSATFQERPLEVSKDKFARSVLQNLNKAADEANSQDLKYLVNCGELIDDRQSITGEAPIHKAVISTQPAKNSALVSIIGCNANLDTIDSNGWTALHHASSSGDLASATTLIEAGANIDAYSNQGRTALHFASMYNHVPVIRLLLAHNAKLEAADELHCTPLHLACKKGAYESVCVLLAHSANIYASDERKWTPLHYAAYNGEPHVCKKLLTWEADYDPKLRDTLNSQNKVAFNICKNPETKLGFRIIWRSATIGDLDMCRILIREGQDVNEQTQDKKNTALHLAAKNGHNLIVKYLLDMGATCNQQNAQMKTPLDFCRESLAKCRPRKGSKDYNQKPEKGSLLERLLIIEKDLAKVDPSEKKKEQINQAKTTTIETKTTTTTKLQTVASKTTAAR